jgi:hypothetical protein
MQLQNFSKSFLGLKIPKILEFFSTISWRLCAGTECEKVVLSTGIKSEKLNFNTSKILNSPLVMVLNPKSTTFSHSVPAQSLQEIVEKNS